MKSSSSSCLGSFLLLIVALVAIRFALPELWLILAGVAKVALSFGVLAFLALIAIIGYFTYRNLQANKQKKQAKKYEPVGRTETLYRSVVNRLQQDLTLNQISAEEFLQSEILVAEKLQAVKNDLVRLKDFASPQNEKVISEQVRNYRQQMQQSREESAREVIAENLKILEEKKNRIAAAQEEIRQKEASVDLVYNSLVDVDEDLKFGRAVRRLFPPDLYRRFDLTPPSEQTSLPPLTERSSSSE